MKLPTLFLEAIDFACAGSDLRCFRVVEPVATAVNITASKILKSSVASHRFIPVSLRHNLSLARGYC